MTECHHYGCDKEGKNKLKAWGPGEVRSFCDQHVTVREQISGYTDKIEQ